MFTKNALFSKYVHKKRPIFKIFSQTTPYFQNMFTKNAQFSKYVHTKRPIFQNIFTPNAIFSKYFHTKSPQAVQGGPNTSNNLQKLTNFNKKLQKNSKRSKLLETAVTSWVPVRTFP